MAEMSIYSSAIDGDATLRTAKNKRNASTPPVLGKEIMRGWGRGSSVPKICCLPRYCCALVLPTPKLTRHSTWHENTSKARSCLSSLVILPQQLIAVCNAAVHDPFHLFHGSRTARQIPHSILRHNNIILQPNASKPPKPLYLLGD